GSAPSPTATNLEKSGIPFRKARADTRRRLPCTCAQQATVGESDVRECNSMEVGLDTFESAKTRLFDTSSWGAFCDVTLTLKQARASEKGAWIKIEEYSCRQAFRHFMNLLNRAVYGAAFRRYGKSLRVLAVLERGEVRASALRSWERGTSG